MFDRKEYCRKYYIKNRERILKESKQWQANNPEKAKTIREKYYLNNKSKVSERIKQWHKDNPEKVKEIDKKYYIRNKEKIKEQQKKWYINNVEHKNKYKRKWNKTEVGKANNQRGFVKRQAKLRKIINTLTSEEWLDILKEYKYKCAYCGKKFNLFDRPTRDHVIPISKEGNNVKENIIPACRSCNSKKNNKIIK